MIWTRSFPRLARGRGAKTASAGLALLLALLLLASTACLSWRQAPEPLPALVYAAAEEPQALILLLPGLLSDPEDFDRHGFVEAIQRARPNAEVRALDLHPGYYRDGVAEERVLEDHVLPARRRGVEEVQLIGISLGGYGAASFLSRFPDQVDGAILLAPWLGERELVEELRQAGGPTAWRAVQASEVALEDGPQDGSEGDPAVQLWLDLVPLLESSNPPKLWLAYGESDRFAGAHRQLATLLPAERTLSRDGGHRWRVWEQLLDDLVQAGALKPALELNQDAIESPPSEESRTNP
ncbi:MAG: hypothetical protein AAGD01_09040 [Acidobacteriota bacterium]